MRIPVASFLLAKAFEGLARVYKGMVYPYLCPANYPTRGYGVRVKDMNVPPATIAQCEQELAAILPIYLKQAIINSPSLVHDENALAAIADFCYNLGPHAYAASTLRKKVNRGDWDGARRELAKWVRGGGRVLPGLVKRRAAEAALLPKN